MSRHKLPQRSAGSANWYFLGFLAIAGYFLLSEHRAHVVPYLPFLLLLACPLMHLFMHRGHDGRGEHGGGGGHQHTSERSSLEHQHEQVAVPDNKTERPDRPA